MYKYFTYMSFRGKRVMGLNIHGCLSNLLLADRELIYKVPDEWTIEEAVTVPLVYTTAIYALIMVTSTVLYF